MIMQNSQNPNKNTSAVEKNHQNNSSLFHKIGKLIIAM